MKKSSAIILITDALLVPALFLFKWLSELMLSQPKECPMVTLGGQCVTCGGTHFVKYILSLRISDAFFSNPFLFGLTVFLGVSFILLNVCILFRAPIVKKLLLKLYSIPSLIIWLSVMLVFFFARNYHLIEIVIQRIIKV